MATTIKLKSGSGAPLAGDLVAAEPAFDLTNKRLYTEDSGGTVIEVGTNPTSLTTGTFTSTGIDDNATSTAITIDSSENVGIGTTSPDALIDIRNSSGVDPQIKWGRDGLAHGSLFCDQFGTTILEADTTNVGANSSLQFHVDGTERMRIDSSGSVNMGGAGTSSVVRVPSADGNIKFYSSNLLMGTVGRDTANNNITIDSAFTQVLTFKTDGTERMSIDGSGNVGIGNNSPTYALDITDSTECWVRVNSDATTDCGLRFAHGGTNHFVIGHEGDTDGLQFFDNIAVSERMRIDSSGNVLVGTTSASGFLNSTTETGSISYSGGVIAATASSDSAAYFKRLTDDGAIVTFRNSSATTVGSIGVINSDNLFISGSVASHAGLQFGTNAVAPMVAGASVDNVVDLGAPSERFDDVYATNGTIQTSDANDKQNIEALSEAEQRVAVAAKGLLRKFRWKSAVEEKGDDARVHFGIIAQDLQAAFEAEGLDAGRYGMFIHSTWTDEETGEERSRMGVRYSELLAFIIAAI